ncbi:FliM/FliN family flagellar motor switch protein [Maribius pontilimi]|uniref:FliM/FliN family flagellar motor switch protein n=1 Tax=Palleronia pontilimi TaxID=1964209 RepID=A0A934IGT4_9RHOB|nr:FliM/FliN family flagellar motor switch protein [Palleronia pontilimi]MBJ3762837.1 FliM/FliN family flagellar motor switch protein [Palleronia pontilimi]
MSDLSPLRRKIGTKRPSDVPPPLTPERVWRRAVQHGLMRAIGLEAVIGEVTCDTILPDAAGDLVEDGALVALLDGPLGYGLIVVSRDLLGAMLEMLTLGRVQKRPLSDRVVTATDAAILADPLDRVLATQQALVAEMGVATLASGYRFATRIENTREIALSLEDETHDLFTIALEAGPGGPRSGKLTLVLPRAPVAPTDEAGPQDWNARIESRVLGAQVPLTAELTRLSLSVRALQNLKPGDTLPLGRHAINDVKIVSTGGQPLCVGRLGQSGGRKAVRIGVTPETFSAARLSRAGMGSDSAAE